MNYKNLFLLLLLLPLVAAAQTPFAYLSFDSIRHQMPEYRVAEQNIAALKDKYEQEAKHNEEEFQRKFNDFIIGQRDFPQNILHKRQTELQNLMESAIAFREECQELLRKAREEMMNNIDQQIKMAIEVVSMEKGYAFVMNTDSDATPFINTSACTNITHDVLVKLGLADPIVEEPVQLAEPLPGETQQGGAVEETVEPADYEVQF